jgi:16S rRNA (cytosine967-C5)-methyltransferase
LKASRQRLEREPAQARPGFAVRAAATALLAAVLDDHRPLDGLLDPAAGLPAYRALPDRDRRLAHAIIATALRRHGEITAPLDRLIAKRPPRAGGFMRVLEIAATQILFMEVADYAAVSVALDQVAADPAARHLKGLANAVLRRLARERDAVLAGADPARLNTPGWLWQRWRGTYGEPRARAIAEAQMVEPYLDLSVRSEPDNWAERLGGIVLPTGSVRLIPSGPIEALPGFAEGAWWVQDAAAALPAKLLGDLVEKRVADLCAAPGGKTAALAALGARVTAVDISAERLERVAANLARLGLEAETVTADVLEWRPPEPFDAVLLDAPCTATGTIRRHPDIPWLKEPKDIASLADLQARMIDHAVGLLAAGGTLVYCTCSLEPEEGEAQLFAALHRHPLEVVPVTADEIGGLAEALTPAGAVRTLPNQLQLGVPRLSGLDGFFIARLRKR